MTTLVDPLTDLDVDLDKPPICENIKHVSGKTCDEVAEWAVRTRCCRCGPRPMKLLCDGHTQKRMYGGTLTCASCETSQTAHIISMVRL